MEVRETDEFSRWFSRLRDKRAQTRIDERIRRLLAGNPGDVSPIGEGVFEMGINHGPGYRVYYMQRGRMLVVLLAGGDKDSQERDIRIALNLAREL